MSPVDEIDRRLEKYALNLHLFALRLISMGKDSVNDALMTLPLALEER